MPPTTAMEPWAKLTTRVTRWTTTKPLPIRANDEPEGDARDQVGDELGHGATSVMDSVMVAATARSPK